MLHFTNDSSSRHSFPGLVTASASGLTVHAQTVIYDGERYDIPETTIPIAWPDEPASYLVRLTAAGIVLEERIESMQWAEIDGIVLAHLRLRNEGDTPETVDVYVTRRECTSETPADAVTYQVSATPVLPDALNPERVMSRRKRLRMRYLRQHLRALKDAGTGPAAFTAAQWRLVNELVALQTDGVPMLVEDVP